MNETEAPVSILETAEGLRLEKPTEPAELRHNLRQKALEHCAPGEPEGSSYDGCFGAWLWDRWRATLEPAGLERERFVEIITGYRREIWYWLLGDRSWDQVVDGLAGRVSRRARPA